MPRLRKPHSAIDCLVLIKQVSDTAKKDQEKGTVLITQPTLEKIDAFVPKFSVGLAGMADVKSISQKEIREKNQAIERLKTYVRDTWEVCRRRTYRENLPLDVFAYYQLPKDGKTPALTTNGQWVETADLIIKGEAEAVAKGFTPMSNPSAAEVQEVLTAAISEIEDVSMADRQLDEAQEVVSDMMPEAMALIDRIIAELNFHLYDKDDASKRRIMRTYGIRFEVTTNEPVEDETDVTVN